MESASSDRGVYLPDLSPGVVVEIETRRHVYRLVNSSGGRVWISGHPQYCPKPIEVVIAGDRPGYIGTGMRLEFWHPSHDLVCTTGVREIRQIPAA